MLTKAISGGRVFPEHREASASIAAGQAQVFAWLDDQMRLAEHMQKPSPMMGGGRMSYTFDKDKGRAVGSRSVMRGRAFGLELSVEQEVTERQAPRRKAWRTMGRPRLVVIGPYEMGFEVEARGQASRLTVWIDYQPPSRGGVLVRLLGRLYARWCVEQMVGDASRRFGRAIL